MESTLDLLLVDDNPIDLAFFSKAVSKTGLSLRLRTLTSGQRAIDYLNAKGEYGDRSEYPWPDLIILDSKMPQVNGFDFLLWRRASPLFSSIPVILFSGSNEPEDIKRVFELGGNKHIVKPGVLEDWERVVRDIWDFCQQEKGIFSHRGC